MLPEALAPWAYVALGMPAMPLAMWLERRSGYVRASGPDPLLPLTLQILFVQVVAFPAILLVWDTASAYVPWPWPRSSARTSCPSSGST